VKPEEELPNTEAAEKLAQLLGASEWQLEAEVDLAEIPQDAVALPETSPSARPIQQTPAPETHQEPPPNPEQILEAMLFIGGSPLTEEQARQIVRGLSGEEFRSLIESIEARYRRQNRPYFVQKTEGGYRLTLRPRYRTVRERLNGTPREAKLTQPTLDVLSLIAYRQPLTRTEIDSLRGSESHGLIRTLVRLGLIAIVQRADTGNKEVYYGTTARFLELFGLRILDDLPTLGEAEPV
jgi:segregation and condensation protein B